MILFWYAYAIIPDRDQHSGWHATGSLFLFHMQLDNPIVMGKLNSIR